MKRSIRWLFLGLFIAVMAIIQFIPDKTPPSISTPPVQDAPAHGSTAAPADR